MEESKDCYNDVDVGIDIDIDIIDVDVLFLRGPVVQNGFFGRNPRLGDILSQGQIVPTAFLGRQIVPSDKMSHFLPRDKLSHQTNCPISSPETKCPTDALIKNHC